MRARVGVTVGLLVVLAVAGASFAVHAVRQDTEKKQQALADGFAAIAAREKVDADDLQAKNAELALEIVSDYRDGYGKPASRAELQGYVDDLTWAKAQLRPDDAEQQELDRAIIWCQRHMK